MPLFSTFIGFQSPKSAGCTITALNLAILHKHNHSDVKVAFLQVTSYPDAHIYSGVKNIYNISEIIPFFNTKEWSFDKLKETSTFAGCDIYHSPLLNEWGNVTSEFLSAVFSLFQKEYDYVYVDINDSVPDDILKQVYELINGIVYISAVDPVSLSALKAEIAMKRHINTHIIFNQCPQFAYKKIKNDMDKLNVPTVGVLPQEDKTVWKNLYEGIPVVTQKKSVLRKEILESMDELLKVFM